MSSIYLKLCWRPLSQGKIAFVLKRNLQSAKQRTSSTELKDMKFRAKSLIQALKIKCLPACVGSMDDAKFIWNWSYLFWAVNQACLNGSMAYQRFMVSA